jgi:flagellar motor switch/type III secretory pathway protein FliN
MNTTRAAATGPNRAAQGEKLVHWRGGELERMAMALRSAIAAWADAWGLQVRATDGACSACVEADVAAAAAPIGLSDVGGAWQLGVASPRVALQLFGPDVAPGSIAQEVADACERDALLRIGKALHLEPCTGVSRMPPRHAARAWGGTVTATLPLGISVLMTADVAGSLLKSCGVVRAAPLKPAGDLTRLTDALAAVPYPLEVELDGCEMDIGALKELQVGDVLRLQHPLDAPASVRVPGGATLFHGFLARSRGRKAVELARRTPDGSLARGTR